MNRTITIKPTIWVSLTLLTLFALGLNHGPLFVPDDARYAEISREMWLTRDFITPHLNFIPYLEKPPLLYWLQAAVCGLFGTAESSFRLTILCFSLLGCFATHRIATLLFNATVGWWSTFILATSGLYVVLAGRTTLDMPLTAWITLSFYFFLNATQNNTNRHRNGFFGFAICLGLAALTKGLVGILIPALTIGLFLTYTGSWYRTRNWPWFPMISILIAITLPWHLLAEWKNPGFLHFYFVDQQISRYLTLSAERYQPLWFYIPVLALGFWPWTCCLPLCILTTHTEGHARNHLRLLWLWATVVVIFFSLSQSKLIPYILPALPPLAILCGYSCQQHLQRPKSRGIQYCINAIIISSLLLSMVIIALPLQHHFLQTPMLEPACLLLACLLVVESIVLRYAGQNLGQGTPLMMAGTSLVILWLSLKWALPYLDNRSIKPLIPYLKVDQHHGESVVSLNHYYQDLPFYLKQRVLVVGWRNELTFGLEQGHEIPWVMDEATFWKTWRATPRRYILMTRKYYQHFDKENHAPLFVIAQTPRDILLSNQTEEADVHG